MTMNVKCETKPIVYLLWRLTLILIFDINRHTRAEPNCKYWWFSLSMVRFRVLLIKKPLIIVCLAV
ncbi:hypothetical protein Hanom_Chr02g00151291 [Helianthus anomalus]